MITKDTLLPD